MNQPLSARAAAANELPAELYLDLDAVELRRRRNTELLNTATIPALRFIGFQLVAGIVIVQNALVAADPQWPLTIRYVGVVELYCLLSWGILRALYARMRQSIATMFLLLDTVLWTGAVFVTGAHRSWLFPLVIVHAADNSAGSFRRVLAFAHFGVFCYAALVLGMSLDPAAGVHWPTEAAKIALLYGMALYFSLTARAADRLKAHASESARISRVLLAELGRSAAELRTRSLETQRALDVSEIASDAKNMFIANMSHELRTPLNSVIGFASVLLRQTSRRLDDEEIDYLERIRSNGAHLLNIINDILDVSSMQAGKLATELTEVDVRDLAAEVVGSFQFAFNADTVDLSLEAAAGLDAVWTDPKRLRQILINLVGNAMKFTRSGSVRVRVVAEQRRPSMIEVIDTGIGIPAGRLDAVFQPFERADNQASRAFGGTGLGLSISRSLCELIGCRIEAESEVGKGSTFRIVLPVAAPALAQRG
jgi:signal transduction histidine kinase